MTTKKLTIDLNSDIGEKPSALADGTEESLIRLITSANVACGGHAGDEHSMDAIVKLAKRYSVNIGAHPSFPDRQNFGRTEMTLTFDEIKQAVFEQVRALSTVAKKNRARITHVKPHGALYNMAAKNFKIAHAIAAGVEKLDKSLILMGLSGSAMLTVWEDLGFKVAAEGFADRRYESDGSLRSRKFSDALISDPSEAARQAARIASHGVVIAHDGSEVRISAATLCIHSDTPNSLQIASAVRQELERLGVEVKPLDRTHLISPTGHR
ncbi:MAG TPA: 5-oxoprolinase subunit PxpA [Bacteroidota bacterium]|nr:5-oxoprolinase subunit PxpA [Bacteroidota bacterium]